MDDKESFYEKSERLRLERIERLMNEFDETAPKPKDRMRIEELLSSLGFAAGYVRSLASRYKNIVLDKEHYEFIREIATLCGKSAQKDRNHANVPHPHSGHRERLRTSIRHDRELKSFSEIELLEIMLSFVIPRKDTNTIAHAILDEFGAIADIATASKERLMKIRGMTKEAAEILPLNLSLGIFSDRREIVLKDHKSAVVFFGAIHLGKGINGFSVAYLDREYKLICVETKNDIDLPLKSIVAAIAKYDARNIIIAIRNKHYKTFDIANKVELVSETLKSIDANLIEAIVFTDDGFYTVDSHNKDPDGNTVFLYAPLENRLYHSLATLYPLSVEDGNIVPKYNADDNVEPSKYDDRNDGDDDFF